MPVLTSNVIAAIAMGNIRDRAMVVDSYNTQWLGVYDEQ